MNWGGFPVAFRFPVVDFSYKTKKRCWSCVLPALTYADLNNSAVYEAESAELFDPDQLIYIAVVGPAVIPPSRRNSFLWRRDGRLMSELVLYQPVVQENYLELYTSTKKLADISSDRAILPVNREEDLFPDRIEMKEKTDFHHRVLILPKGELSYVDRDVLCRRTMRELYEKDEGLYLKMLPLSPGGDGAVYTAAAFLHGRLFSEMIPGIDGKKYRCLFGVLPGRKLLIDGFTVPDISAPLDEGYGLGRAIRVAKDRGFTDIRICASGMNPPMCDIKLEDEIEELYALSRVLPLYDQVILTEFDRDGQIKTEAIDINRRDEGCVSSILSKRSATAES